jgi:nucleotide-binding universal stress UspA family protein
MTNVADTKTAGIHDMGETFVEHQRWGGTYLVVADESEEFPVALQYAVKMANTNKCRVGILYVMESQGFQHWGNVEKRMRDEQRAQAEEIVNRACIDIQDMEGNIPSIYIEEGARADALASAIERDPNVSMLILAGGTQSGNPGPLVSYYTGKGLTRLRVPLMIVPDHLGL